MTRAPSFDDIFAVMAAASVGDSSARVTIPDDAATEDVATNFAVALNILLDNLALRAEEKLESGRKAVEREARNTAVLDGALDCIIIIDHTGKVVDFNPAAAKTFGYSRDEAVGRPLHELIIPPPLRSAHRTGLARYLESGVAHVLGKRLELTAVRADGVEIDIELTIARISAQGEPQFAGFLRDITERNKADQALRVSEEALRSSEAQLRQAQKMEAIGTLAGGVAHDFNNLLSVILTNSEVLMDDLAMHDPMRADLAEIKLAGERAATLTRQLLAFSRQQILEPKILDLNVIIQSTGKLLQRLVREDVELVILPAASLGRCRSDAGQIEQILMNLVVNARDAMPDGGRITVETANVELDESFARSHLSVEAGRYVMLAVSDTGVGMSVATQRRVFEPFFTTKEKGKGTGLGLATVYGIVEQSHGTIWVYSEIGVGTTFKIYLPRTDEVASVASPPIAPPQARGWETILVVEDEDQIRNVATGILRRSGYHVIEARSGGEALLASEHQREPIHLLLTDIVMPKMSGKELAERLHLPRPDMKVLFMSGYTDGVFIGQLAKGLAFLQKPLTPTALANKVREVLDAPRFVV